MFVLVVVAQAGTLILASAVVPSPRIGVVCGVILIIISPLATMILNAVLDPFYDGINVILPIGLCRILSLTLARQPTSFGDTEELRDTYLIIFFSGIGYSVVGIYLHAILPQPHAPGRHPLFFLPQLVLDKLPEQFGGNAAAKSSASAKPVERIADEGDAFVDMVDNDVKEERERLAAGESEEAVQILGLKKQYGESTVVDDLWLSMKDEECFGLLGPNGAGKTTTISILTGTVAPTSGAAFVKGIDVTGKAALSHKFIGICPQQDFLWPDITVQEHLNMFALIKGVPHKFMRAHVRQVAESVGLDGDAFDRISNSLSGGMKRRLSIGLAIIGDPKVLVLDEPTTGLDPETRQHIWKIIDKAKRGRCVILTTHSMSEAEALCNRIGIMASGSLLCLGTQVHLKNKFGDGLRLKFSVEEKDLDVTDFVKAHICEDAALTSSFSSSRAYVLPKNSITVSKAFSKLQLLTSDGTAKNAGIRDWSVSQTSLEEIFIRLAEEAERGQ